MDCQRRARLYYRKRRLLSRVAREANRNFENLFKKKYLLLSMSKEASVKKQKLLDANAHSQACQERNALCIRHKKTTVTRQCEDARWVLSTHDSCVCLLAN